MKHFVCPLDSLDVVCTSGQKCNLSSTLVYGQVSTKPTTFLVTSGVCRKAFVTKQFEHMTVCSVQLKFKKQHTVHHEKKDI